MSTHKNIDKICCFAMALCLVLVVVFANGEALGIQAADRYFGYEDRLFDDSVVHTIDIQMDDWEGFLSTCTNEEYSLCDLVVDGESYSGAGIRAKGNTSLSSVAQYGNDRYSFKIEFDHYDNALTYHGLDKLNLNNLIQDNTMMKDYVTYQLMGSFGVDAPLCSYVYITVNGEDWGLYLAVEGVEDSFLQREYGNDYGELYKPDSLSMGGGRGNGQEFDSSQRQEGEGSEESSSQEAPWQGGEEQPSEEGGGQSGGFDFGQMPGGDFNFGGIPEDFDFSQIPEEGFGLEELPDMGEGGLSIGGFSFGGDDVSLVYTDDDYDSYSNIFNNAKTDVTDSDKDRLIQSIKQLNEQENLEEVVDVDEVIRGAQLRVQLGQLYRGDGPQLLPLRGGRPAFHDPLGLQSGLRRVRELPGCHQPGKFPYRHPGVHGQRGVTAHAFLDFLRRELHRDVPPVFFRVCRDCLHQRRLCRVDRRDRGPHRPLCGKGPYQVLHH